MKLIDEFNVFRPNTTSREFFDNSNGIKCVHYGDIYKNYSGNTICSSSIANHFSLSISESKVLACDAIIVPDVTETESDWGHFVYIKYDGAPYINGTHTFAITCQDKLALQYLFRYFYGKKNVLRLQSLLNGSTVFQISAKHFGNFELLNWHNTPTQRHIVNLIGSIDDKIENNEKVMQIFNTYINAIFNKFTNNDSIMKIGEVVRKTGKPCKNKEWQNSQVIDLSIMQPSNLIISQSSNGDKFDTNVYTLPPKTLLYGSIRPYFKKAGFSVGVNYVTGTVHSFECVDQNMYFWILATIGSGNFHNETHTKSQGTKMPIINWEGFGSIEMPAIENGNLEKFNVLIEPFYQKICNLILQNRKLHQLKSLYLKKFFETSTPN
ncbi:MAG: restriction endonuclease subunit S [Firmicutes bacterium]|nr:restriction endonuclease subunit S [Bacillota bacterium]